MKRVQNTIVIGVDHGYGNIKTANRIFQSGVVKLKPGQEFAQMPLIHKNERYLVGQGHKTFVADKFVDEDYYILTGHYACYEMIGREQTEEIIAPYGKHY